MVPIISIIFMILLPAFALNRNSKGKPVKRPYLYSCGSFALCAWGIIEQILTIKRRLFAGDIGGIEDTIGAVLIISLITLIAALIINTVLLAASYEENTK